MRLENLIREITEKMYEKITENRTVSEEEAKATAKMVGMAAIKYGDLSNQAAKDYVFDVDRFTSFEGNTGPYILYTIVRIKSILNKYKESGKSMDDIKMHHTRSAHIFMILQMHLTVSTMRQRSWQKRMSRSRRATLPFLH